ncbi:YhgN family NAAT transporter [Celerinatantimonas sp. MCCC 1A17872]|uniref:YhgN family NAAT transporter n=1 Tax=Celerinatantimonas sp. MCCC 1A17872 TaxID=3177514 RepID=UPI0038C314DF
MSLISATLMLFLIMDPLGNTPVFMAIMKHIDRKRQVKILIRELIFALIIMMAFLWAGEQILSFLNLRQEAVSIAGGIILFLIALKMIFPGEDGLAGLAAGDEPFLVPMAIPMIAGPSILATLLLMAHQDPTRMGEWSLALILAWLGTSVILISGGFLTRYLGERGLTAIERLMGMILIMLSVQMLLDGVAKYLHYAANI